MFPGKSACLVVALLLCHSVFGSGVAVEVESTLASVLARALERAEAQVKSEGLRVGGSHETFVPKKPALINVSVLTQETIVRFPGASEALKKLNEAYKGQAMDAFYGRALELGEGFQGTGNEGIYGELLPTTVVHMLHLAGAAPGMHYYDLGSGTGKTVLLASLLGLNATGVELARPRWSVACDASRHAADQGSLPDRDRLRHVRGSFMDTDLSDADIIFANNVMWGEDMKTKLGTTMLSSLRPGTKIVSFTGFQGLQNLATFAGPTSWSSESKFRLQSVPPRLLQTGKSSGPPESSARASHEECAW